MTKEHKSFTLHQKLSSKEISFIKKLKIAVKEGELDYWWARGNPPNESPDVFRTFLNKVEASGGTTVDIEPKWIDRESSAGPHGLLGEDQCFKFECDIAMFGIKKRYFVKGYFFNKGDLKGVSIQSFREVTKLNLVTLSSKKK